MSLPTRDTNGRFLKPEEVSACNDYLIIAWGCRSINNEANITSITIDNDLYKVEFTQPLSEYRHYVEIPDCWIQSHIRNKKIDYILRK